MSQQLQQRLALLAHSDHRSVLQGIQRGIEKESLRINADGSLAQTPHPRAFGSALTHPQITTDFSEALLEFITPVSHRVGESLQQLDAIHRFVYSELDQELLWPASMPCLLGPEESIPVAQYGSSNIAHMKTLYRMGLSHRYGRRMQTIAGIHFNFSLPDTFWPLLADADGQENADQDFVTAAYFDLIRNFRRHSWLLIYLFGAAPAACRSFLNGNKTELQELTRGTIHLPFGTSLRMGDLGYQSNAQQGLTICYNNLDNYIQTLRQAITTPHPEYQQYDQGQQLSPGLLQIENEFYSPIRPKRVTHSGEIPLGALRRGGVEYIEVRCVDVNPDHPLGIDEDQIHFLDCFLLHCLLSDSPPCDDADYREITNNLHAVVDRGRQPGLELQRRGEPTGLSDWAGQLLEEMTPLAEAMDNACGGDNYRRVCAVMRERIDRPELTPSARMIEEMRERDLAFFELMMERARQHAEHFRARPLSPEEQACARRHSEESLRKQADIEADDDQNFDDYLRAFYAQYNRL